MTVSLRVAIQSHIGRTVTMNVWSSATESRVPVTGRLVFDHDVNTLNLAGIPRGYAIRLMSDSGSVVHTGYHHPNAVVTVS